VPARSVQDYIETALEPLGDVGGALGTIWEQYVSPGTPFSVGALYREVVEPSIVVSPPAILPSVRIDEPGTGGEDSATPGPEALPPFVVDPELGTEITVFEAPEGIYQTNRAETDWDAVYEQWVILNPPPEEDVLHESIDWGAAVGTILGGILDPFGVGQYARTALAGPVQAQPVVQPAVPRGVTMMPTTTGAGGGCPPLGPKYAKICLATNEITPLRRRRRRRLLTSSDIKDLAALKAIVGGAALQGAVVQAIRR